MSQLSPAEIEKECKKLSPIANNVNGGLYVIKASELSNLQRQQIKGVMKGILFSDQAYQKKLNIEGLTPTERIEIMSDRIAYIKSKVAEVMEICEG